MFPATYELKKGQSVDRLVTQQLATFRERFDMIDMRYARRKNLTPYDVLIIASMVEREAQVPRERRLIAAVIYNRLRQGINLGIDATIRYATGNWTEPLRVLGARVTDALQHPHQPGPAPGTDRQPRPRLARGGRESRPQRRPLRQARHLRRARVRRDGRRAPAERRPLRGGADAPRRALADRLLKHRLRRGAGQGLAQVSPVDPRKRS